MPARILDGKSLADSRRAQTAVEVAAFKERTGVAPGLVVVLVGDDPASQVYVRNKSRACREAGVDARLVRMEASTSQAALLDTVASLNADDAVHAILVQLPLPKHIDESRVIDSINPLKDVDGFHPINAGLLATGRPQFVPCTPLGVQALLRNAGVPTRGARAVVFGRSNVVGRPMAQLLLQKGDGGDATVTVAHTATRDPARLAREADILIVAAGRPELVRGDWIKPGAAVIDVGIHKRSDGSLCGDVDFATAREIAAWITPVPGGVGPMTVAMLIENTLKAARIQVEEGR